MVNTDFYVCHKAQKIRVCDQFAGQTRRNLAKAARLAEDDSARKILSALSRHISREIRLGHDYELEFNRIQDQVQPRLLASLTVFNDQMDDYTHVYPIRQLAKCLLMKAFSCDTVADSIDNLEQLKAYIPDKWFAAVLNDLLEDLYNVWVNHARNIGSGSHKTIQM